MDKGRDGVICHVAESVHHAAAESAAGDVHVAGVRPPVSFVVIVLDLGGGGGAVVSSHDKEVVIDHRDAKVAARDLHGGDGGPGVSGGVVGLSRIQTSRSIKTTNLKVNVTKTS